MSKTLPSGWEEKTLGEVSKIGAGNSAPQDQSCFINGSYNFFRTSDIGKVHFGKIEHSEDLLNQKGCQGLRLFKAGTILIPKSGASTFLNHRVKMEKDGYVVSHLATVEANSSIIDADYLLYFLATIDSKTLIQSQSYPSLNLPIISSIKVFFPTLPEQKRIVEKLDKIFANIDKAKENTKKNLQNAKEVFSSFLTKVFNAQKSGWVQEELQRVCTKISAGGDKPNAFSKERTSLYKVPVYANGEKNDGLLGFTDFPTITKPAITVAARGTIGFTCKRTIPYCPIVRLISLIPNSDKISLDFLFYALKYLIPTGNGTSIPQLTLPTIKKFSISYPISLDIQADIVAQLDALRSKTQELEQIYTKKLADLDELKQSILQQVFSGKL